MGAFSNKHGPAAGLRFVCLAFLVKKCLVKFMIFSGLKRLISGTKQILHVFFKFMIAAYLCTFDNYLKLRDIR